MPDTPNADPSSPSTTSLRGIDQGIGKLVKILKEAGRWDDTLVLYIADHGMASLKRKNNRMTAAGSPLLVRNPYNEKRGVKSDAMISWIDLTPTILDFAGALDADGKVKQDLLKKIEPIRLNNQNNRDLKPGVIHGRSFLGTLEQEKTEGWDEIGASHTFHEIQMYSRALYRTATMFIWNIAPQDYPFASDLWA